MDYETVRNVMNGEPFPMNLTETDEIKAVVAAVNQGIDASSRKPVTSRISVAANSSKAANERRGSLYSLSPHPGMCYQPRISSHPSSSSLRFGIR